MRQSRTAEELSMHVYWEKIESPAKRDELDENARVVQINNSGLSESLSTVYCVGFRAPTHNHSNGLTAFSIGCDMLSSPDPELSD